MKISISFGGNGTRCFERKTTWVPFKRRDRKNIGPKLRARNGPPMKRNTGNSRIEFFATRDWNEWLERSAMVASSVTLPRNAIKLPLSL